MPERYSPLPIDVAVKLASFSEYWSPKAIAAMNDYEFKLVKLLGEFTWHDHTDTDETFLVLSGHMTIEMRDHAVTLGPGQLFVVPRGVEHCPHAAEECHVLLIEPAGVVNTGEAGGPQTAACEWV